MKPTRPLHPLILLLSVAAPARIAAQEPAAGDRAAAGTTALVRVTGRLVGVDGRPIGVSSAVLQTWDGGEAVDSVPVGPDGAWSLEADASGPLVLRLSGAGHRDERVGILQTEPAGPLRVEARLVPSDPRPDPERDGTPYVRVTPDDGDAGLFGAFSRELFARVDAYFDRRARAEAAGSSVTEMRRIYEEYDPAPDAATLARHLEGAGDATLRAWMTTAYLAAPIKTDPSVALGALAGIPPESPVWSIDPRALPEALVPAGRPDEARAYAVAVAERHADPGVRAIALGHLLDDALRRDDPEDLDSLYARLVEEHPGSKQAARARELYAPDRRIQTGRPVPDFAVASMDDSSRTITRESLLGRTYLMDFWATWCGPCITEMPWLHAAQERFGPAGFTILSLSFDLDPQDVVRFRAEGDWTMPWMHAFVEDGTESILADDFDIVNIPRAILVGPDGRILATNEDLRGGHLAETLARALGTEAER